ncbi:MAG: type I secretion system permease/ATPase [Burkholderiales bacterium]|nr:type I secretion system permease/ATPase [Burkholderiales bacterium]
MQSPSPPPGPAGDTTDAAGAAPPAPDEAPAPAGAQMLQAEPLFDSIVFLARFFGAPVHPEPLRAQLASLPGALQHDELQAVLQQAGLSSTLLAADGPRRDTELPALVLGRNGRVLAVLARRDGRYEVHDPGIAGSHWLDAATLRAELGAEARWLAVRPALYFDQRSLLYTLPRAGRWFWDTFGRSRWIFRWALLGTLALNVFGALLPFYTMAVYDRVIPNNALNSLGVLTVAAALIIGFELVMRGLRTHLLESASRRMDVALSAQVYAQCLRLRAAGRPASGGVLANTVREFEAVRDFFASGTLALLGDLPFLFLFLGVIALVGGWLVVVPLAAVPILLGVALAAQRPLKQRVSEGMRESAQRTAHLFESMNGLDTIKSLGAEAWSRRKWEGLTQAIAQNSLETREITARVNHLNAAVTSGAYVAVIGAGAMMAAEQALSLGQLIAVSLLTGRALAPAAQIAGLIVRWQHAKLAYEALDKVMGSATDEAPGALHAPPLSGRIEFRDVGFAYPGNPPLLDKLNLQIRPGERVGIIGKLGSGKSTLLRLMLNQYAPGSGSVLLDDLSVTQLEPLSLRRQIGYVPQDLTLFHGTIRDNIELGRAQPDDAALLAAVRDSVLDETIAQLPQGVGTEVGERGERLSGGQRQAVAIARALLARPRLLLLDEPSSMFDPASEQKLIARLRARPDTTIVLVTHRMAMLALVDRLIVMDRGQIVADGPRDEVLRRLQQGDAAAPAAGARAAPAAPAAASQPLTVSPRP